VEAGDSRWPLPEQINEEELFRKLLPEDNHPMDGDRPGLDWEEVRLKLKKKGVTLNLLWIE
jgi:hypothetical protein